MTVPEVKPVVSPSDSKLDLGFGGFDSLGTSPAPQILPEPVVQTEEESAPSDSTDKSMAPSIPVTPPAVIPSTPSDIMFAAEPTKVETSSLFSPSQSKNPESSVLKIEPQSLPTTSPTSTTPIVTSSSPATSTMSAVPTPAVFSPPTTIASTPAVEKHTKPPPISNPSVTLATATLDSPGSSPTAKPPVVSTTPITLTSTAPVPKPQTPSVTPAAPKPAVLQPLVPTAEHIQAAVAPAIKAPSVVVPAKTTPKAPTVQSSSGVVKTTAKTEKIADKLGLEFDDGGSTEIVRFAGKNESSQYYTNV